MPTRSGAPPQRTAPAADRRASPSRVLERLPPALIAVSSPSSRASTSARSSTPISLLGCGAGVSRGEGGKGDWLPWL